jgi:hypothetical protein
MELDGNGAANLDAELAAGVSDAIASQAEVATAPALQDAVTTDSTVNDVSLQTPVTPSWRERLGFNELDDDAAIAQIEKIKQYGGQAYQQAQYLHNQNLQYQQELQQLRQAQQAAVQPAQPKAPEQPKLPWEPVPFDEEWSSWIDPQTRTWRENTPHQVVIGFQKHAKAMQDFNARLYSKPNEVLTPLIEQHAQSLVSPLQQKLEALEARYQEQEQQQQIASLLAPYTKQFYAHDASGQVARDQYGNPVLTQIGQDFNAATAIAHQMGFTDPKLASVLGSVVAERNELQRRLAALETGQAAPAQAAPQPTARQAQDSALLQNANRNGNGVNRMGNRGGTLNASAPATAPVQNESTSMEDVLRQSLRNTFPNGIAQG